MRIGVFGDCHGRWDDLNCVINGAIKNFNIDTAIQVGDFGFYPLVFDTYEKMNLKFKIPVYVIDGNHEDHIFIKKEYDTPGKMDIWKKQFNIHYMTRGSTLVIDTCKMGFFGGALNVDTSQKGSTKKRTTNYPLNVEVEEASETFNKMGKLDFLFTHSCPHSIGVGMRACPMFFETIEKYITRPLKISTGPIDDCGEQALTNLWHRLNDKPSHVCYGHFHSFRESKIGTTTFTCVGCVDSLGGHGHTLPFIVDTKAKTLECFPGQPLLNTIGLQRNMQTKLIKNDYPI